MGTGGASISSPSNAGFEPMPDVDFQIKLDGWRALAEALRQLPGELSADILAGAVRGAAEPIARSAAARARKRSGKLARSITVKLTEHTRDRATALIGVGVRYSHLIEFGHRVVARGPGRGTLGGRPRADTPAQAARRQALRSALVARRSAATGRTIPAYPYLRPAFDEEIEPALHRIQTTVMRTLSEAQALRRLAARAAARRAA